MPVFTWGGLAKGQTSVHALEWLSMGFYTDRDELGVRSVTQIETENRLNPIYRALTREQLAQQFDCGEYVGILPPLTVICLDV